MGGGVIIHHSEAVSDAKFNKITAWILPTHRKKKDSKEKKKGIFRIFSREVRKANITVAIEDTPVSLATNRGYLEIVEQVELDRESFMVKKNLDKSKI